MKCEDPFIMQGKAFPCGKCLPCLGNRRRIWKHRLLLELTQHGDASFVTLTYSDENLPLLNTRTLNGSPIALPTLLPEDLRNWLKRFRKAIEPSRIRFYACGEYGGENQRPHYHAIIFGYPTCRRGRTLRRPETRERALWAECCPSCALVGDTWGKGDIDLGMVEADSCGYVAGYIEKKLTRRDDVTLLGREPEFSRMSNRPGIGFDALHELASEFMRWEAHSPQGDVPVTLRHGARHLPLGRYLRMKLRKMVGRDEKTPDQILALIAEELRPVREAAFDASRSLKAVYQEENKGRVDRFHARRNIFKQRRLL